jgi:hypothetical protein
MEDFCEHGNEPSGSFFGQMKQFQLFNKDLLHGVWYVLSINAISHISLCETSYCDSG